MSLSSDLMPAATISEVFMERCALAILIGVLTSSTAFAQTKSPVEGVWKIAELVFTSGNPDGTGTAITNPQPGVLIFTRGYYSQVYETGAQPRAALAPPKDLRGLTDPEKIARYEHWRAFAANSGVYEVKGSMIIKRAIVAKNAAVTTRQAPIAWEFKLEGLNTLWLIPTGVASSSEPRIKYTRLE